MNTTLIWLLALPIAFGLLLWLLTRKCQDGWIGCGVYAVIGVLVVCMSFFISTGAKTKDTEIWSGKIVAKERDHGHYLRSYQCNCRTVSSRNSNGTTSSHQECDTCYEDRYTVKWTATSTVGTFTIDSLDRTTRRVYDEPDPQRYTIVKAGDPASKTSSYTNYIQAVPNSLFTPAAADLKKKFVGLIPAYPDTVYDLYKIDRFLSPGWNVPDAAAWNADISNALRDLGGRKQVNLIVVVAKTDDVNYEYALRDAWEGANKNDVVLIVGSTQYPKIDFVRVLSWTKNETFKIQLRDAVMDKGTIDRSIIALCAAQIEQNFQRRQMKEFAYLDGEIDPPEWLLIVLCVVLVAGAAGVYICLLRVKK